MLEPHLSDFIGKRLKDIYHEDESGKLHKGEKRDTKLVLEFENDHRIVVQGVGDPAFSLTKGRVGEIPEDEEKKAKKEKKKALAERKEKESKQKNRPKKK